MRNKIKVQYMRFKYKIKDNRKQKKYKDGQGERKKKLKICKIPKRHSKNIKISWAEKKVIITSFRL